MNTQEGTKTDTCEQSFQVLSEGEILNLAHGCHVETIGPVSTWRFGLLLSNSSTPHRF